MDFVAEEYRAAPLSDENARQCCSSVSCCTLGRRKCAEVSPKRAALHSRATKMRGSVTQAYRILLLGDEKYGFRCRRVPLILTSFCPTPTGNKKGRKCRLNVSCRTFGRRKCATVLPKSVVLHSRATKMRDSVAQECRAALSGDENARKCHPSVSYFTLGRRKVWVSLPKSPFILTSFCLAPFGNENGLKCRLKVSYCTLGRRRSAEVSLKRVVLHSRAMKMYESVA